MKPSRSTRSLFLKAAEIPDPSRRRTIIHRVLRRRGPEGKASSRSAVALDPYKFKATKKGGGVFGHWIVDKADLPAYKYRLDQRRDKRASFPNSEWADRRDNWHQLGNDRITALASNDGTVQVYLNDRGGVFLNRFEAPIKHHGFRGWLDEFLGRDEFFCTVVNLYREFRVNRLIGHWKMQVTPPRGRLIYDSKIDRSKISCRSPTDTTQHAYAGGYSYIDDGQETWATAYRYRPDGPETKVHTRRIFGMGYFKTEMNYRKVRVERTVYAPYGNDPVLLVDVVIENCGDNALDIHHYEYWDVNVYQLKSQPIRTGLAAAIGDEARHDINEQFRPSVAWDETWPGQALRFKQAPKETPPPQSQPSSFDWYPDDIFLIDLTGEPDKPKACYTEKAKFFGKGGAAHPTAVSERRCGETDFPKAANAMPYCLVLRRDLHIEPGKTKALRYAYGTIKPNKPLEYVRKYQSGEPLDDTLDCWKYQLAYFTTGDPVLHREMAWHAYNLLSATVYQEFYHTHVVPQGSAYLYLHGFDGVPRDYALFTIPLTYLRPDIACETLTLIMKLMQCWDNALAYAISGFGRLESLPLHERPSDLDLFFLLALVEYIAATGDVTFLDQRVDFYPPGAQPSVNGQTLGTTVLDHIRAAFAHLNSDVGLGQNGLIKIGSGDWSDGIVCGQVPFNPLAISNSTADGESIPNSQMALYVLPLAAALVKDHDSDLAQQMRALESKLKGAIQAQWLKRQHWYRRAILRDGDNEPHNIGDDQINLEAQPWALISNLAADQGVQELLIESILKDLDDQSPIGAPTTQRGQVWPAISQLLTWGYTRSCPELAWRSLNRNTFAAHATVFPNIWFNIWSGSDGINSQGSPNAGGTWTSMLTPMTDFPVMNANPDAMALLGLLRVAGIEPAPNADGLVIAPKAPPERFILDLPLLRLDVEPGSIAGVYRPIVDGSRKLYVSIPKGAQNLKAEIDGQPLDPVLRQADQVELGICFEAYIPIRFCVHWQS